MSGLLVPGFATSSFLVDLGASAGSVALVFAVAYLIGWRIGRFNVVDAAWGLAFVAVAVDAFLLPGAVAGTRRWLLLVMVGVWGLRLAAHIGWRSRGQGEDPRYVAMFARGGAGRVRRAALGIFVLQAAIVWFVSLPVQVGMFERPGSAALDWVGVAVWAVGVFFESVGDAQLAAFRGDPANRGKVLDSGLWRYTRHPNYFGDACVWTGIYLAVAGTWPGALTIASPLLMGWFLARKTGKPLLERSLAASKPGYAGYIQRTSGFFPLPPRRSIG